MMTPFGVAGSVHVTSSELEVVAVTVGGATPLGAGHEYHINTLQHRTAQCNTVQ